jgi:hypothetical protein
MGLRGLPVAGIGFHPDLARAECLIAVLREHRGFGRTTSHARVAGVAGEIGIGFGSEPDLTPLTGHFGDQQLEQDVAGQLLLRQLDCCNSGCGRLGLLCGCQSLRAGAAGGCASAQQHGEQGRGGDQVKPCHVV